MKTIINNSERVFFIATYGLEAGSVVCNLKDIPRAVRSIEKNQPFKIYHIWNHRLKVISKKVVNEMFYAHNIEFKL